MRWRGERRAAGTGCSAGKRRPAPTAGPGTGSSSRVRRGRTGSSCGVRVKRVEGGVSAGVTFPPLLHHTTTLTTYRKNESSTMAAPASCRRAEMSSTSSRTDAPAGPAARRDSSAATYKSSTARSRDGLAPAAVDPGASSKSRVRSSTEESSRLRRLGVWVGVERGNEMVSFLWRGVTIDSQTVVRTQGRKKRVAGDKGTRGTKVGGCLFFMPARLSLPLPQIARRAHARAAHRGAVQRARAVRAPRTLPPFSPRTC